MIRNLILEPPLLTKKGWFDTSPFFEVARSSAPSYFDSAYYFESGGLEKYLDEFPRLARHFKRECVYMAVQEGFSRANIA